MPTRLAILALLLLPSLASANEMAATANAPASEAREPRGEKDEGDKGVSGNKVREGTQLKENLGGFRAAGDRVSFVSADGQYKLVVLENLTLERVARVLKESGSTSQWLVSGTVTEYQGTNYLLVTRAILKHRKGG